MKMNSEQSSYYLQKQNEYIYKVVYVMSVMVLSRPEVVRMVQMLEDKYENQQITEWANVLFSDEIHLTGSHFDDEMMIQRCQ